MPLYVTHDAGTDGDIFVFPEDTANNGTPSGADVRQFNLPAAITNPRAVVIDGNALYVTEAVLGDDSIFVVPADTANNGTATATRTFTLPSGIGSAQGLAIDGNNLYVGDSDGQIYVVAANTANNGTATTIRQFTLPSGSSIAALTIEGNDLYVGETILSTDRITVVPADTANGTTLQTSDTRRFTLPSDISSLQGIAVNGNDLYIVDQTDADVYIVPADTTNGTTLQSSDIVRQFNLPSGLTDPRGMALEISQATYTLSTDDTDIREGESVTIDVTASVSVTDLAQADFSITGGTITGFSGSGTDYELTVTAGLAGTMEITLAADAGTPGNAETSESFTINAVRMLHIADGTDDNIRVIRHDTGSGATAQPVRTYEVTDSDDMQSIVFDGTHIHVTNWNTSTVRVFSPSGVNNTELALVRSYTVTGISQPSGMAFDGTNIHISDRNDDNIRVIAPDTADGGTATIIRTYTVDGLEDCRAMTFDGTNLHAADYTDDNIRVFTPNHTSGDAADLTYTVAGLNHCRAMGFDGVNLHLFDVNDHNIRVIAVPTADGAQTVLRTYNAQAAESVRGMTATPMAITIHTSDDDIREGESVNFEINADLDITGLTLSDLTLTGATAISLASVTARRYQLQATADTGAGDIVISIPANAVIPGNIAVSKTFTRSARATATITFANTDLVNNQQTLATITFSEAITSFDRSDLSLSTGTLGATLTEVSDTVYRISVTAPATGSGTMTLSIPQDSTIPENALAAGHIDYAPPPSTDITASITMPTNLRAGRTANATVEWSESVNDFDAADVSLDAGTLGTITGTGTTYTLPITAPTTPDSGTITLTIREDAVSQGNAETSDVISYSALPTVTMTTTTTRIRAGHIFVVRFQWSEAVTGFATGDVTVTNATKVNFVAVDGDTYTMALRATAAGDIVVTVAEDAVNELNAETQETFTAEAVPTVAITFDETELETGQTTTVSMDWSDTPTGFTVDDVIVSAGSISGFAVDGTDDTLYTATLTAPDSGSGTIQVSIPTDSIDEGNIFTSATIDYAPPPGIATTLEIVGGNNQSGTVSTALANPLVVQVNDQHGDAFQGATVTFSASDGTLSQTSVTTDANGQASTRWTLPATAGDYTVTASVTGLTDVMFAAIATEAVTPPTPETQPLADTYNADFGYNVLPESLGALKRINSNDTVSDLGNPYYEQRPFNVAMVRALSFDDELHIVMGYGNPLELLRHNSLASRADNAPHLIYGTNLHYILPTFSPGSSVYETLADLATKVGATLSFDGNLVRLEDRAAFRTKLNGSITTTTANIAFDAANKTFPSSGYIRVEDELIGYTGISSSAFTGITRGVAGTSVAAHSDNTDIVGVDVIIARSDIEDLTPATDNTKLFNVIADSDNQFEVEDDNSAYQRKVYTLDLGLTNHDGAWTESIFDAYLQELKDFQNLISVELIAGKRTNALDISQVVGIRYAEVTYSMRIVSLRHRGTTITIQGRTV